MPALCLDALCHVPVTLWGSRSAGLRPTLQAGERLSDLPKVTELGSGSPRIQTQASLTGEASMNHKLPTPNLTLRSQPASF